MTENNVVVFRGFFVLKNYTESQNGRQLTLNIQGARARFSFSFLRSGPIQLAFDGRTIECKSMAEAFDKMSSKHMALSLTGVTEEFEFPNSYKMFFRISGGNKRFNLILLREGKITVVQDFLYTVEKNTLKEALAIFKA